MPKRKHLNMIAWLALGATLPIIGFTLLTWQFWVVLFIVSIIDVTG